MRGFGWAVLGTYVALLLAIIPIRRWRRKRQPAVDAQQRKAQQEAAAASCNNGFVAMLVLLAGINIVVAPITGHVIFVARKAAGVVYSDNPIGFMVLYSLNVAFVSALVSIHLFVPPKDPKKQRPWLTPPVRDRPRQRGIRRAWLAVAACVAVPWIVHFARPWLAVIWP